MPQLVHQVADLRAQALHLAVRRLVQAEDVDVQQLPRVGEACLPLFADDDLGRPLGPRVAKPQGTLDGIISVIAT